MRCRMWPIRSRFAQTVPPHASGSPIVLVYLSADRSDRHSHRIPNVTVSTGRGSGGGAAGPAAVAGTARVLEFRGMLVIYTRQYTRLFLESFFLYDKAARRRDGAASPL